MPQSTCSPSRLCGSQCVVYTTGSPLAYCAMRIVETRIIQRMGALLLELPIILGTRSRPVLLAYALNEDPRRALRP